MYTQYYIYIYTTLLHTVKLPPRRGLWIVRASQRSAPRTGNSTLCSPWRGGVYGRPWKWCGYGWKNHGKISENHGKITENHGKISENHGNITENHGTYGKKDGTSYRKLWENPWEYIRKLSENTSEHFKAQNGGLYPWENRGKSWKRCSSNPFLPHDGSRSGAARKMVCHGSQQEKTQTNVSINIPAPWILYGCMSFFWHVFSFLVCFGDEISDNFLPLDWLLTFGHDCCSVWSWIPIPLAHSSKK